MAGYGKRYTQEFKDSAIQLALNSQKSVLQTAKELATLKKEKEILKKAAAYFAKEVKDEETVYRGADR